MDYSENEVLQYIAENDVKFIKLFFTDIFGTLKSISIQPCELDRAFRTGISFEASAEEGFLGFDESDLYLVPDPATLSVLPWRPQHGRVVRFYCNIRYPNGRPFEGDSRHILQEACQNAAKNGFDIEIGTECEFYLFQLDEKGRPTDVPHDEGGYCDLAPIDKGENVRREICLTLEQMGIQPETSHHESGPGQHEIDFKHAAALQAADNLATFKTVVRTIASRSGLHADFSPKPLADKPGNGLHINLSVRKNGCNIFSEPSCSEEAKSFLAGVLNRIRETTAFLNSTPQSYSRFGHFDAPLYIGWSHGNRNQLVRVPNSADASRSRIELRSPDPSCNQYTAFALIIAAGLEGIEARASLQPELQAGTDARKLPTLPRSLAEAAALAGTSGFIKSVLPEPAVQTFIASAGAQTE
ncbi:MAG: glutamine synthetase family protein [Treponemataceae bacterium]|nr:glutamine synthetase family protein [Treponemataceae bacterium]